MSLEEAIQRIEESDSRTAANSIIRPLQKTPGLSATYFGRLAQAYASDPARAARLARHWPTFARYGDDIGLAFRAKGASDRMAGRWLASAKAFIRSGELAPDAVRQSTYPIGAIDGLAKAGQIDQALELGLRLADSLDALGEREQAARARLNAANALLQAERGADARRLFEQALPEFVRAEMPMEEAMCRLGISTTHLYGGDPSIAQKLAAEALSIAQSEELEFLAALCEMNLAHHLILSGQVDDAFAALRALRPRLADSPVDLARLEESIGDACLRLNLIDEAFSAYQLAYDAGRALPAVDVAHILLGLGEAGAELDQTAARQYLRRAQSAYQRLGNDRWRANALAAQVELDPLAHNALRLAESAIRLAEGSPYHETVAYLALAEVQIVRRRPCEDALAKAEDRIRRYGFRRFAWRVHYGRARSARQPLRHFRRMFGEIVLGRLATSSVGSREGFLRDKSAALRIYLTSLLRRPTLAHVEEARNVIRSTRGSALVDEILSSGAVVLSEDRLAILQHLREEAGQEVQVERSQDARSLVSSPVPNRLLWTEASHVVHSFESLFAPATADDCVVMVEADGDLWAISQDYAKKLPMTARALSETLDWFSFEMRMINAAPLASATEANAILKTLRRGLLDPLSGMNLRFVCPDGVLWRVPWDALNDDGSELTLVMHPSFSTSHEVGKMDRVALWIDTPTDLPHAVEEEIAVRKVYPQCEVFRSRAEVTKSWSRPWDLVHVVGHAHYRTDNPMFSALEFSDGPIYASEIARSGLRTRVACLSACETGRLSLELREEPNGIVRAFLGCGAQSVLASLWPLDDEAASIFFQSLYTQSSFGTNLPQAVQEARRFVRQWRDHPYYWASLSLFGGYQS
jgi:tetratricopeptide (TPR) repeat protein